MTPAAARLRSAALRYAALSWHVLPLHTPTGAGGCSCSRPVCDEQGKHPRTRHGVRDATTNRETIAGWWARWPVANVGVATGVRSGLVVVDIDGPEGEATLERLEAAHERLPDTRQQVTARGLHLVYAHPGGVVRNSNGNQTGPGRLGPGLDVRGDGGFIVAAPSRHAAGMTYTWTSGPDHAVLAPLPGWLHQLLTGPGSAAHPPPTSAGWIVADAPAYVQAAVAAEVTKVLTAPPPAPGRPGARNDTLNRAAFALGTLVGAGVLDRDQAHTVLVRAGVTAGLAEPAAAATVTSGLAAGARRPRRLTAAA